MHFRCDFDFDFGFEFIFAFHFKLFVQPQVFTVVIITLTYYDLFCISTMCILLGSEMADDNSTERIADEDDGDNFERPNKRMTKKRTGRAVRGDWPDNKIADLISIVEQRHELWATHKIPKPLVLLLFIIVCLCAVQDLNRISYF